MALKDTCRKPKRQQIGDGEENKKSRTIKFYFLRFLASTFGARRIPLRNKRLISSFVTSPSLSTSTGCTNSTVERLPTVIFIVLSKTSAITSRPVAILGLDT